MAKKTPAQKTWTDVGPDGLTSLQRLAKARADLNPGWLPPGVEPLNPAGDPTYIAQSAQGNTGLNDTYAGLGVGVNPDGTINYQPSGAYGGQYLSATQSSGFDENGNPITDASDPRYNPFSALNVFKANYENTKRGTVNSSAANGQLYAGSLLNAQASDLHNYDTGYDTMSRGSKSYIAGLVSNAIAGKNATASADITNLGDAGTRQAGIHAGDPFNLTPNLGTSTPAPAKPKTVVKPRRTLTLGGRIANRSGLGPKIGGPFGY